MARSLSSNSGGLFNQLIRKLNKIYYGSETPYVAKDEVLEKMIAADGWKMPMPQKFAKINFLRDRARADYLKHNVRIRKLEDKVTGGAVGIKSFTNRF